MNVSGLLVGEEERAARQLAIQAEIILSGRRGDIPQGFVPLLFGRAAPEDLVRYEPKELAALAEAAWSLLGERKAGTTHIRIENRADVAGSHQVGKVTVIEIVNDDMPFLLDSVLGELTEQGILVRLVVHPIVSVERGADGNLIAFRGERAAGDGGARESFIHIHIDRIEAPAKREALMQALEQTLRDVRLSVQDWQAMRARVQAQIAAVKENPPPLPIEETAEAIQFLEWLLANNFTFLGIREYEFSQGEEEVEPQFESGLGILRQRDVHVLRRGTELVAITPEVREFLAEPKALIITKANVRSRVHRRVHMDYIGVKRFDSDGKVTGEFRIVGLFTSNT